MVAKGMQFSVQIARSILLIPLILKIWGDEKYGVWLALYSFFNLMLAIDLGHGLFISNEINKTYHVEKESAKKLLGSGLRVIFISALLQFFVLSTLYYVGVLGNIISNDTISSRELFLCLCLLFGYRMFLGGFKGILVKLTYPVGYIDRAFYIGVGEQILEVLILFYAAITDISLLELCIYFVSIKSVYAIIVFVLIKRWIPEFFPWWQKGDVRTGIRNYITSMALAVNSFLERFSNDGLNIIVSSVLGSKVVPLFSTTKVLANLALQLSGLIIQPFQPELSRFYAKKEYKKVINVIKLNWLFAGLILCLPFIIVSPWIEELYTIWTSGKLIFDPQLYSLLIIGVLIFNYGNSYVTYLNSINNLKALLKITVLRGTLICGLSVILTYQFGLIGIGISIVIAEVLTSLILPSYFVNKELKEMNMGIDWQNKAISLAPVILTCIYHALYFIFEIKNTSLLVVTIMMIIVAVFYQWRYITPEIRERIKKLVPGLKKT